MKRIIIAALVTALCFVFAGCGSGSGFKAGEQFQLGENTYALEKWERMTDKDTDTTEGYAVCLLQVGDSAPVIITGLGTDNMSTESTLDMTLNMNDSTISPNTIGFQAIDDVEGYGSRVTFSFDIPKGEDLPESATFINLTEDDESVQLNLKGLDVL